MVKLNSDLIAVKVEGVSKTYMVNKKPLNALKEISFEIPAGTLFGLIGPDGAGKTTLFRLLTTLLLPDAGNLYINNMNVVTDYKALRKKMGYMPGKFSLYTDLTVEENLLFFASLFDTTIEANYDLIKDIYEQIAPFKNRRAGQLSGGMKQKLALCCALIHRPDILFLDEPTTGVDAVSRKEFWEMLQRLKEEGITILVSTPYMDEASLCDQVALIQQGKILHIDTPGNIVNRFDKPLYALKSDQMLSLLKVMSEDPAVADIYPFGEVHHMVLKDKNQKVCLPDGVHMQRIEPNIEDLFIYLMRSHD